MTTQHFRHFVMTVVTFFILISHSVFAGVFTTPHYLSPGSVGIGIEPQVTFNRNSGIGGMVRGTLGLTELSNLSIMIGAGGSLQKITTGANLSFDVFPDTDYQPGIGMALQGLYYKVSDVSDDSGIQVSTIPYIRKSFKTEAGMFEPFLSYPIGLQLSNGYYDVRSQLVLGTLLKVSSGIGYVLECGIGTRHAEAYLSGGITLSNSR